MPVTVSLNVKELLTKLPLVFSIIVIVSSITVIYGWFYNIEILKSWLVNEVNMKFSLAFCFLLGAMSLISLYYFVRGNKELPLIVVPIASLLIFFMMGSLLLADYLELRTGLETLFISEDYGATKTVSPGMPPPVAMFAMLLFALANILVLLEDKYVRYENIVLSLPLIIIGALSFLGYIYSMPLLYFRYSLSATPVSFNTAILFLFLGLGQIFLLREKNAT